MFNLIFDWASYSFHLIEISGELFDLLINFWNCHKNAKRFLYGSSLGSSFGSFFGSPFGSPLGSPFGSPFESPFGSPFYLFTYLLMSKMTPILHTWAKWPEIGDVVYGWPLNRNFLSSSEGSCIKIHLRTSSILSIPLCLSGSFTPSRTRQETLKIYSRLDNIDYTAINFSADFCNLATLPACLPACFPPKTECKNIRQIINEATKNSLCRTDRMARLLVVMHSRYSP